MNYNTIPKTNIPILSPYIVLNWDIGSGFWPNPASIVYPGLLYSCKNQSLYPAKLELKGTVASLYPLTFSNVLPIVTASTGA